MPYKFVFLAFVPFNKVRVEYLGNGIKQISFIPVGLERELKVSDLIIFP